MRNLCK